MIPTWNVPQGFEYFFRDAMFHRGLGGASLILQRALGFEGDERDGDVGPHTLKCFRGEIQEDAIGFLHALRVACEGYELAVYGHRDGLWQGLENRWDNRVKSALTFPLA